MKFTTFLGLGNILFICMALIAEHKVSSLKSELEKAHQELILCKKSELVALEQVAEFDRQLNRILETLIHNIQRIEVRMTTLTNSYTSNITVRIP
jgi:DNA-binding LytR/AlgR family response regulator